MERNEIIEGLNQIAGFFRWGAEKAEGESDGKALLLKWWRTAVEAAELLEAEEDDLK